MNHIYLTKLTSPTSSASCLRGASLVLVAWVVAWSGIVHTVTHMIVWFGSPAVVVVVVVIPPAMTLGR